jgi:hypothetical protein
VCGSVHGEPDHGRRPPTEPGWCPTWCRPASLLLSCTHCGRVLRRTRAGVKMSPRPSRPPRRDRPRVGRKRGVMRRGAEPIRCMHHEVAFQDLGRCPPRAKFAPHARWRPKGEAPRLSRVPSQKVTDGATGGRQSLGGTHRVYELPTWAPKRAAPATARRDRRARAVPHGTPNKAEQDGDELERRRRRQTAAAPCRGRLYHACTVRGSGLSARR